MDIKRTILLIALAVVTYAMVLQWNQDYGQPELPEQRTQLQTGPSSVPELPANGATATADVPTAPNAAQGSAPAASPATGLIRVATDVLEVGIDPQGGDIVELRLLQYPVRGDRPDVPFPLFERGQRLYEAQSGLIGDGPDKPGSRPLYTASQVSYLLSENQDQLLVDLTYSEGGVNYIKRFTFERGDYDVAVDYLIDNQSGKPWTGYLYGQLKRDSSGDPSSSTATGTATYLGAAVWTPDEPYRKISMGDMDDERFSAQVQGGWVAWLQHYFVTAWIPGRDTASQVQTRKDAQGNYIVSFLATDPVVVPAGSQGQTGAILYAGPKIQEDLEALAPGLELTVDYGILWFLAQPIFWLLELIHDLLGNWGWSIIVLTIIIKLAFFPLSAASYRSMARMRAVAPKMQSLKEQYGDDRQKMSQAMMELYKKEKINPLGGCLPILVQMPVFLALYWVLLESVEMRQAPWMFWITDLSVKDPFFILPLIMGATMFIQMSLNPTPPDPMQARIMKLMPIVFTFFFLWFPAGLVLYWVVNNILSIGQQWYITRKIEAAHKTA